jgi:hypothetical protein
MHHHLKPSAPGARARPHTGGYACGRAFPSGAPAILQPPRGIARGMALVLPCAAGQTTGMAPGFHGCRGLIHPAAPTKNG